MTHIDCVRFCEYVLDVRPIDFVCRTCVYNGDDYDWEKALIRLVCIYYETLYGYVTVMWTASSPENTEPNHFVLLVPYRQSTGLPYTCSQSPPVSLECPADNAKDDEPDTAPEATGHIHSAEMEEAENVSTEKVMCSAIPVDIRLTKNVKVVTLHTCRKCVLCV